MPENQNKNLPIFEIWPNFPSEDGKIIIYADGQVEGINGLVINRIVPDITTMKWTENA